MCKFSCGDLKMELSVEDFEIALDVIKKNKCPTYAITQKELEWVIDQLNKNDKVTVCKTMPYHPGPKPIDGKA